MSIVVATQAAQALRAKLQQDRRKGSGLDVAAGAGPAPLIASAWFDQGSDEMGQPPGILP